MVEVRPLRETDWALIEALYGERGACGGCWCMEWRRPGSLKDRLQFRGEKNRRAFRKLVESGRARGVLALEGGKPVGWCSAGPHLDFPALDRKRVLRTDRDEGTWTITCFFIAKSHRNRNKICSARCASEWGRISAKKRWGAAESDACAPSATPSSRSSRRSS